MSRDKHRYPDFDAMLQNIGNMDYDTAFGQLQRMASKYQVARDLLLLVPSSTGAGIQQRNTLLQAINTYTYGGTEKTTKSLNTQGYKKSRTDRVIAAEDRLSGAVSNPQAEAFFAGQSSHAPTHLRNILPGQSIGVSLFATPRGGTHRIDRYEGSVEVG